MSRQNEEEFDMEEYVADVKTANTNAKAPKKAKLSAKHESLMVFGFWFVQQLGLDGEEKERAYALLKLKGVDVPEQTEFYESFTDKAAIHKAELRTYVKVPKVRKPRAPRKPKVDPAALELVQMAQEPKDGETNTKKPRAPRKSKANPVVEEPVVEAFVEESVVEKEPIVEEPPTTIIEFEDEFQPIELAPLGSTETSASVQNASKKRGRKPKEATRDPEEATSDPKEATRDTEEEVEVKNTTKQRVTKTKSKK
jgi:hypothetical protein